MYYLQIPTGWLWADIRAQRSYFEQWAPEYIIRCIHNGVELGPAYLFNVYIIFTKHLIWVLVAFY
jgi:hypothetical protein